MNLTTILDDCLTRLAAGESVAQCLARYPDAAPELAPMLAAAEQLRAFSAVRLSQGQRLRAKVALREELAAQAHAGHVTRRGGAALTPGLSWPKWRFAPLAAIVAVVLFSTVAFSAVAASQPGDFAYPVRVAVERAPVWFQFSASGRVAAELALAERRLAEVTNLGRAHPTAIDALLRSDTEAIARAEELSEAERAAVAARVAEHAKELAELAGQSADPAASVALRNAASEAEALASRLDVAPPPSNPTATVSAPPENSPTPEPYMTPAPVVVPTLSETPPAIPTVPTPVVPTIPPIPTVVVPTVVIPTIPPPDATAIPWPTTILPSRTPRATSTPWPTAFPTLAPFPTVGPFPTFGPFPTVAPFPTGIATQGVETPVIPTVVVPTVVIPTIPPLPTVVVPTIPPFSTVVAPTVAPPPTLRPPGAQLTATVVWLTMTPPVTPTPRPDLRLTVTLTVVLPRQTRTPEPTPTPAPPTEAPGPTATQAGQVGPTQTTEAIETAAPAATPTLPPMPR